MQMPKYIPQFDSLRGVAVLAVMLFHGSHDMQSLPMARYVEFGWTGVDLFFVLSGFLITGILLDTRSRKGYFANFYARRILRIWPLYFALLGGMFLAAPFVAPRWAAVAMAGARPVWPFVLFMQNLAIAHAITGPLSATWSLAIEEQFYFAWPLLIWLLPRKGIQRLAIAIVICSPLLRLGLTLSHAHVAMYFNTFTRLDGLAAGSFLAIWLRDAPPATVKRWALATLPVALLVAIFVEQSWIRYSAIAIAAGGIVCLSFFITLRNCFVLYTGRISYGLYLLHLAAFGIATKPELRRYYPHAPALNDLTYLAVGLVLSYGAASLSWYFFESRILRAKKWFGARPGQSTSTAIAATALQSVPGLAPSMASSPASGAQG